MKQNIQLARLIHILIHMGESDERESSETIGRKLNINPMLVRRMLGILRNEGLVRSTRGRAGCWEITRHLTDLTILDVQKALNPGLMIEAGLSDDQPTCQVERIANATLERAFTIAENTLRLELSRLTLADLSKRAINDFGSS